MAAFIDYTDLQNRYPPQLVVVREINGKYFFECIFNLLNFMT